MQAYLCGPLAAQQPRYRRLILGQSAMGVSPFEGDEPQDRQIPRFEVPQNRAEGCSSPILRSESSERSDSICNRVLSRDR